MMEELSYLNDFIWGGALVLSLALCPLLPGIINKVKAFFAGRRGPRVLQLYYDMAKLLRKESVYSSTSCGFVRLAPLCGLAATFCAMLFLPYAFCNSPLAFGGDVLLFLYFLGFARVTTVLGALDTGSSFEGMGASREVHFSALAEAVLLCIVVFFIMLTGSISLSGMLNSMGLAAWTVSGTSLLPIGAAIFIVMLSECCRVPFDDPETHLELTMIHEAMILDNGGPDLALIHYGAALKLWLLASFFVTAVMPFGVFSVLSSIPLYFGAVFATAVAIGVVESAMARFRFLKVPQMLMTALCLAVIAIVLMLIFEGSVK